jgi:hypothetical protein
VGAGYLFDTNIVLRLTRRGDSLHAVVQYAVRQLLEQNAILYYCPLHKYGAVFRGNRSVTVAALIGAARVSKRFPDTLANF